MLYFSEYSPDVLKKKTNVLDIFNTDIKCLMKINIESSPPEIWIRFHNGSGSPLLVIYNKIFFVLMFFCIQITFDNSLKVCFFFNKKYTITTQRRPTQIVKEYFLGIEKPVLTDY